MALSQQWLDELRARVTLSDLIGRHVKIQRAGREYKACCPFHFEKTPSFTINDQKGFYHCFGCGAHGDAIGFLTDNQGMAFMDAVKELASLAGMTVPAPDPKAAKKAQKRATLHDVMQQAQDFFTSALFSEAGAEARAYLLQRGFAKETMQKAGFGFAPDNRNALKNALLSGNDKITEKMLIEAGLLISVDDKPTYDRFRGRVMIPIRDIRGRVIAFGGRILGDGQPKYLNSPDTPLFDKGNTLYNVDIAAAAARKNKRLIIVEGYMDAIALMDNGIDEVVAPLGTALTEQQIIQCWKHHELPILCFDGDNAGKRAAARAITRALPILKPGHSLNFVTLPEGQDPDDFLKEYGKQAYEDQLAKARNWLDILWAHEQANMPQDTPEMRAGFKKRLFDHLKTIEDHDIRNLYWQEANDRYQNTYFKPKEFRPNSGKNYNRGKGDRGWQGKARNTMPSAELQQFSENQLSTQGNLLLNAVLIGLARHPQLITRYVEPLCAFEPHEQNCRQLLELLLHYQAHVAPNAPCSHQAFCAMAEKQGQSSCLALLNNHNLPAFSFISLPLCEADDNGNNSHGSILPELDEAIEILRLQISLDKAIAMITPLFKSSLDEKLFENLQKLHQDRRNVDTRLFDLLEKHNEATG